MSGALRRVCCDGRRTIAGPSGLGFVRQYINAGTHWTGPRCLISWRNQFQFMNQGGLRPLNFGNKRSFRVCTRFASESQSNEASTPSSSPVGANSNVQLNTGVLVTGGTSGIGFEVARHAILAGATHVRLITRNKSKAQAAVEKLRDLTQSSITLDYVAAHTPAYSGAELFHTNDVSATNPRFTIVVHCAGMAQNSLLTSMKTDDISGLLRDNLESAALLSRNLLTRYMQFAMALHRQKSKSKSETASATPVDRSRSWQVINISSLLAMRSGCGASIYAASKAGMIALTRTVALEGAEIAKRYSTVAPGFRANVVVPGYIDTPMTENLSKEPLLKLIPSGRFGTPAEVADAVMFLIRNEYANNCVLNLDGGLSAV